MSVWVPPYFGSYDQLVAELLNNPFLGSGRGGLVPSVKTDELRTRGAEINPQPLPPRYIAVVSYLSTLVSMQELVQKRSESGAQQTVGRRRRRRICGLSR